MAQLSFIYRDFGFFEAFSARARPLCSSLLGFQDRHFGENGDAALSLEFVRGGRGKMKITREHGMGAGNTTVRSEMGKKRRERKEGRNVMGPDIFARFKGPGAERAKWGETLYKCPRSTFERDCIKFPARFLGDWLSLSFGSGGRSR